MTKNRFGIAFLILNTDCYWFSAGSYQLSIKSVHQSETKKEAKYTRVRSHLPKATCML